MLDRVNVYVIHCLNDLIGLCWKQNYIFSKKKVIVMCNFHSKWHQIPKTMYLWNDIHLANMPTLMFSKWTCWHCLEEKSSCIQDSTKMLSEMGGLCWCAKSYSLCLCQYNTIKELYDILQCPFCTSHSSYLSVESFSVLLGLHSLWYFSDNFYNWTQCNAMFYLHSYKQSTC